MCNSQIYHIVIYFFKENMGNGIPKLVIKFVLYRVQILQIPECTNSHTCMTAHICSHKLKPSYK